jgi:hypothetical protein
MRRRGLGTVASRRKSCRRRFARAKADVRQTIREEYDELPEVYDRRFWEDKVERTFQVVVALKPGALK